MEIWYELTGKDSKARGYNILTGNIDQLTLFDDSVKEEYEMIIPLRFWFCKDISLSLPIIALLHSNVEVFVELKKFEEVSYVDNFIEFVTKPRLKCKMIGEYIFIEDNERKKFATSKLEYLMDTLQYHRSITVTADKLDENGFIKTIIYFQNSIKELFWVLQDLSYIDGSQASGERQWNNYSASFDTGRNNVIESVSIEFSGRDRELVKNVNYYNYIKPYEHHNGTPSDGINMYSFSLEPEKVQPSGGANFSRIDDAAIVIKIKDSIIEEMRTNGRQFRLAIYGASYNILRVMSGMGGLAFYQ